MPDCFSQRGFSYLSINKSYFTGHYFGSVDYIRTFLKKNSSLITWLTVRIRMKLCRDGTSLAGVGVLEEIKMPVKILSEILSVLFLEMNFSN